MSKEKPKNKAESYDSKFDNNSLELLTKKFDYKRAQVDPEYSKRMGQTADKLFPDTVLENFDLSKNKDHLEGWENPHTIYGGLDTSSTDPFNELRASRQSGELILKGLGRATNKFTAELVKLPGYLSGLVQGTGEQISDLVKGKDEHNFLETATNNAWIKGVEEVSQNINEELMPVYVSKAVKEGNLWNNITSGEFWATEGADGVGFMTSMLVPGAILKSLGLGNALYKGSIKSLAAVSKIGKGATAYQKLAQAAITAEKLGLSASKFDVGAATIANTYLESAAETGFALQDFDKRKEEIISNYMMNNKNLSYKDAEKLFNTEKGKLGSNIFTSNILLLTVPNALQSSMLFGKKASSLIKNYGTKEFLKQSGKRIVGNFLSEGFIEEAGQTTAENYFKKLAEKGKSDTWDLQGFADQYLNTITSTEGQKAIFLGGFLGSTMSVYQGAKEDLSNVKKTKEMETLTSKYEGTLRSIIETDTYKRNDKGEIIYINNKPLHDPAKVKKVFEGIETISKRFEEFETGTNEGNVELVEKARNKAIQDLILPFIQEGEIGLEKLESYYDEMLKAEDVQQLSNIDELEARKNEILDVAKDASKKYENYVNLASTIFNIEPKDKLNPIESKLFNSLVQDYFRKLSSSYTLYEMDKKQIDNSLKEVLKNIKQLEDINEINKVTIEEANNLNYEKDFEKTISESKKEALYNSNKTYKDLKDYQKRLEDKLKEINETSKKYFDKKTINEDFWNQFERDKKVEKEFEETVNEENEVIEGINESTPVEEKLETASNEVDDIINLIKDFDTQEEILLYIKKLPENIKNAVKKHPQFLNILNGTVDKETFNTEAKQHDTAILGHENTENIDSPSILNTGLESSQSNSQENWEANDLELNEKQNLNKEYETEDLLDENINNTAEHVLMSVNTNKDSENYMKPLFEKLKKLVKFEKEPRDKTNDKVTFQLGDFKAISDNKSKIIQDIWIKVSNGENLDEKELDLLYNYLPIQVTITNANDSKDSAISFLKAYVSGKSSDFYNAFNKELNLRKSIINQVIKNKGNFNNFEGSIKKQFKGKINLESNVKNNVSDLSIFKGKSKQYFRKYIKDNLYYINYNNQFVKYLDGSVNNNYIHSLNGNLYSGDTYLMVTRPNGELFPLKLNINRISKNKAENIAKLCGFISIVKSDIEIKDQLILNKSLKQSLKLFFGNNIDLNVFEKEIHIADSLNLDNYEKLETLLNILVNANNNNEVTKMYFSNKGDLLLGTLFTKASKYVEENPSTDLIREAIQGKENFVFNNANLKRFALNKNLEDPHVAASFEELTRFIMYKQYNTLSNLQNGVKAFENEDYIDLLFNKEEPYLSTNASTDTDLFTGYTNLVLNSSININSETPIIKEEEIEYIEENENEIIKNNSENILNSEKNSVSLQENVEEVIVTESKILQNLENDNLTEKQKAEIMKIAISRKLINFKDIIKLDKNKQFEEVKRILIDMNQYDEIKKLC